MATNRAYDDATKLSVVCTNPTTPLSGQPIRFGGLTGVALTDEGGTLSGNAAGATSVDFGMSAWVLTVDDNEGAGIAVGDTIYYHDTGTGTGSVHLNNSAASADAVFGIALQVVTANATTAIIVLHLPFGFTSQAVGPTGLSAALQGTVDGLGLMHVAKATFDPSATSGMRTIAAHGLGVTIPDNAIVCGGFIDGLTTFTSATDAATIAISLQTANDIRSAVAISTGVSWDAPAIFAIVPKANTPESTGIKLTAAREITATVAVEALTAGKCTVFLYYTVGD